MSDRFICVCVCVCVCVCACVCSHICCKVQTSMTTSLSKSHLKIYILTININVITLMSLVHIQTLEAFNVVDYGVIDSSLLGNNTKYKISQDLRATYV